MPLNPLKMRNKPYIVRYCIGALCRGEKKFKAYFGARLCKACRYHAGTIDESQLSFSVYKCR